MRSISAVNRDGQKIGFVQIDMQFAVERWAGGFDIGNIEYLSIGAPGKAGGHRLTSDRVSAVAAGDVGCFAALLAAARTAQPSDDTVAFIAAIDEFGPTLNRNVHSGQACDQ